MQNLRLFLFRAMCHFAREGKLRFLPDALFLRVQYWLKLGRVLRLGHPRLYNEKLQWIKLHDRKPEYHRYADKLAVRDYVAQKVGDDYLIPLIAAYDEVDAIQWDPLPERFVIKCTHASGANLIVTDKGALDIEAARRDLNGWMKRSWFDLSREWPYKEIPPRIIVEQFLGGKDGAVPFDYKIMCFEGEPTYIIVDADRYSAHTRNFYDINWVKQDLFNRHPNIHCDIPRPKPLQEMIGVARALCEGLHHVRIDLYVVDDRVYFGEMTFFHGYGMEVFRPKSFELHMGDLIKLPTDER